MAEINQEQEFCAICLDSINANTCDSNIHEDCLCGIQMQCCFKHFHKKCLVNMINLKALFRIIGIAKCPTCRGKFRIISYEMVDELTYTSELEDLCIDYMSSNVELIDKVASVEHRIENILDKYEVVKNKHIDDINKLHSSYKKEIDSLNREIDQYSKELKDKNLVSDSIMLSNAKAIDLISSIYNKNSDLQIKQECLKYKVKSLEDTLNNNITNRLLTSTSRTIDS